MTSPIAQLREADNLQIGGVFDAFVSRHHMVQDALERQDPERVLWARRQVMLKGWDKTREGYIEVDRDVTHNIIPTGGLNYVLDLLLGSRSKVATWYHGPFTSNWTPMATAGSNWAGSTSGPLATELQVAQFEGSNRKAATFATSASNGQIAASATTQVTIAEGVQDVTVHGTTLNSTQEVGYNNTDAVLLAATRFPTPKSGLGATDTLNLSYTISLTSA